MPWTSLFITMYFAHGPGRPIKFQYEELTTGEKFAINIYSWKSWKFTFVMFAPMMEMMSVMKMSSSFANKVKNKSPSLKINTREYIHHNENLVQHIL